MPRFWCGCAVCQEARTTGANRRTRSSALVRRGTGHPAARLRPRPARPARPAGHAPLIPGAVLDLTRPQRSHSGAGRPARLRQLRGGPPEHLRAREGHSAAPGALRLRVPGHRISPRRADCSRCRNRAWRCCGFAVRAFEVPHGANGTSHAFHFNSPAYRWVYMTDAIDVPDDIAAAWLTDLNLLVLGTSFHDESGAERSGRSVYDVQEALRLPWARAAGQVLLSHLSHDVDGRRTLPGKALRIRPRRPERRTGLRIGAVDKLKSGTSFGMASGTLFPLPPFNARLPIPASVCQQHTVQARLEKAVPGIRARSARSTAAPGCCASRGR